MSDELYNEYKRCLEISISEGIADITDHSCPGNSRNNYKFCSVCPYHVPQQKIDTEPKEKYSVETLQTLGKLHIFKRIASRNYRSI